MVALRTANPSTPVFLAVLVAGLLLSGSPSLIGPTFLTFQSKPALGVDICHPLQSAASTTGAVPCVSAPPFLRPVIADFGAQVQWMLPKLKDRSDPPETPPPR